MYSQLIFRSFFSFFTFLLSRKLIDIDVVFAFVFAILLFFNSFLYSHISNFSSYSYVLCALPPSPPVFYLYVSFSLTCLIFYQVIFKLFISWHNAHKLYIQIHDLMHVLYLVMCTKDVMKTKINKWKSELSIGCLVHRRERSKKENNNTHTHAYMNIVGKANLFYWFAPWLFALWL